MGLMAGAPSTPPTAPSGPARDADGTIQLSPVAVALSAAVLVINGVISFHFKLNLHTQLVVASVRMVVQLSVLGYMLVPIFTYDKWWLVLLYGVFMLMIASLEAAQRPGYTFQGLLANTAISMASSSGLLLSYLVLVVLALRPVWEAQYIIPLLGMLLGNATSAISVGLTTVLEDLAANRAVIEHLLALGANRYEATAAAVQRALKVSMTPLLNQMSMMGIVSIPGMMTGQILAGGDPSQAARYQMVIMFIIVAATCLGNVTSIYLAVLHVIDSTHTYRADRLLKKQPGAGMGSKEEWLAAAQRAWATARRKGAALGACLTAACCCCFLPPPPRRRRPRPPARTLSGDATPLLASPNAVQGGDSGGETRTKGGSDRAGGAAAAASPFAAAASRGFRWAQHAKWPWPVGGVQRRSGGAGSGAVAVPPGVYGTHAAAYHLHQQERLFSADSTTSSFLSGGLDGGLASPTSVRSTGALAAAAAGGGAGGLAASWEQRLGGEGLGDDYDDNASGRYGRGGRGGFGGDPEAGPSGSQGQGPAPSGSGAGGWAGGSAQSMVGSGMSAVVSVGGWLGSQASASWGAAWDALGRWRGRGPYRTADGAATAAEVGQAGEQPRDGYRPP